MTIAEGEKTPEANKHRFYGMEVLIMFELTPFDSRHYMSDFFDPFASVFSGFEREFLPMRTDIEDAGESYELKAEMPGFKKEDIKIDLNGDTLTISAEHKEDEKIRERGKIVRRERRYGSYKRSFDVSGVDTEKIAADYKDGILYMVLPKKAPETPHSRRIELK